MPLLVSFNFSGSFAFFLKIYLENRFEKQIQLQAIFQAIFYPIGCIKLIVNDLLSNITRSDSISKYLIQVGMQYQV